MDEIDFRTAFEALTDNAPFPWQTALYEEFRTGLFRPCNLPTGLGKTSVIAIWLIAMAQAPKAVPRRLVYIVNRRTVVDQATSEAERLRTRLLQPEQAPPRADLVEARRALAARLQHLTAFPEVQGYAPLAISTLRGQFADNGEWRADPARPGVVVGTIDMIGSRLLFSGYGIGYKTRPLHAGFLGHDALIVHDEAHLSKPFNDLLEAVVREQAAECRKAERGQERCLKVVPLTATSRGDQQNPFSLTPADYRNEEVVRRLAAAKEIKFWPVEPPKKKGKKPDEVVVAKVLELALAYDSRQPGEAVLVYLVSPEQITSVRKGLVAGGVSEQRIATLTGTMRGYERDRMTGVVQATGQDRVAQSRRVFARFQPWRAEETQDGTVYLLCTSAGEVGADLSGNHMVCDLTTFESMAQRLGRVNRRGDGRAYVDVVHEAEFDTQNKNYAIRDRETRRQRTLELLKRLPAASSVRGECYDGSPGALSCLREQADKERSLHDLFQAAFSRPPKTVPATDILFDAWALTTLGKTRDVIPARPPVERYLHGLDDPEPPRTTVAWRADIRFLDDAAHRKIEPLLDEEVSELLGAFRLMPWEQLSDRTDRVRKQLTALAQRHPGRRALLQAQDGSATWHTLAELGSSQLRLDNQTVLLPTDIGGLGADGTLGGGGSNSDADVADVQDGSGRFRRVRVVIRPGDDGRLQAVRLVSTGAGEDILIPDLGTDTPRELVNRLTSTGHPGLRVVGEVALVEVGGTGRDDDEADEEGPPVTGIMYYLAVPRSTDPDLAELQTGEPQSLADHTDAAEQFATRFADRLELDQPERAALICSARGHDSGKARDRWQRAAGRRSSDPLLAKPVRRLRWELLEHYRHEFGSLVDMQASAEFTSQPGVQDLILHLIATHHGRGRPHFPAEEAFAPGASDEKAIELSQRVLRQYANLQRKYGRWGLAWLESLLRAADALASGPNPLGSQT